MYSADWRDFSMNDYADVLTSKWNSIVAETDQTIIVGDIGHYCPKTVQVLSDLKGIKFLVLGNHDTEWGNAVYSCGVFAGIHRQIITQSLEVVHIPDETTIKTHYYIHGHHHTYQTFGMRQALSSYAKDTYRLNCASDLIGHKPCTLQELVLHKELLLEQTHIQEVL